VFRGGKGKEEHKHPSTCVVKGSRRILRKKDDLIYIDHKKKAHTAMPVRRRKKKRGKKGEEVFRQTFVKKKKEEKTTRRSRKKGKEKVAVGTLSAEKKGERDFLGRRTGEGMLDTGDESISMRRRR